MRKNKNIKKSLILTISLAVGGLYTSTHTVHAVERQVVRTETLNVRKAPSVEESKVEILDKGTIVEILEKNKEWNKIKIDGNEGWIHSDYISNEKAKATVDKLNVRKGPSIKDSKIEFLSKGTDVEILEVEDDWYKIKYDDKKTGWVNEEYILTETQVRKLQKETSVAKNNNTVVANNNANSNEVASNNSQNNNEEDKSTSSNNNTGRSMTVNASAYSGHTITATGTTPKWGTIAVDPSVIPYGTRVYIPKFNMVFIAEDCGGAIKGNKIDIFMNSEADCNSFGRQNIEIQILG